MNKNLRTALLLLVVMANSSRFVRAEESEGATEELFGGSRPAASLNGLDVHPEAKPNRMPESPLTKAGPHVRPYMLEDYHSRKVTIGDIRHHLGNLCESLGALCGSMLGFIGQYKLTVPLILLVIMLNSAFRSIMKSK